MQDDKIDPQEDENLLGGSSSKEGLNNVPPSVAKGEEEGFVEFSEGNTNTKLPPHLLLKTIESQNISPTDRTAKPNFFEIHSEASNDEILHSDQNANKQKVPNGGFEAISSSRRNRYFGKFVLMIFITSCAVILFSSIINKTRQERFHMLEVKKALEKQAARLGAENAKLESEYAALKNDPVHIEKEAREQLGFIRPDEVVYQRYNFRIKSIKKKEPIQEVSQNRWMVFFFEGPFRWQFPALIILIAAAFYLISYHYEYRKLYKSTR